MYTPHTTNIAVHVIAGTLGMALGVAILLQTQGTPLHRKLDRIFVGFPGVVCLSALVGTIFSRFVPVFAVLTLLVT